jgi:hypothetical protein
MTPAERFVGMAVAVIGCAATVIMVPEVRCAMGMDSVLECTNSGDAATLTPPLAAALRAAPREDRRIDPIRQRYSWIESSPAQLRRFEPVPLEWGGADSASIVVYSDPAGIAKITARIYSGNQRNVLKFYYSGTSLVFVHQVQQSLYPERNDYEQRFYFDSGQMFRWLTPEKSAVSDAAPEFARNSRQLVEIGNSLLSIASGLPRVGT